MTDEDILLPKDESKPLDLGEIPEALPKTQVDQEKLLGFWLKAFEITTNGARKSAPDLKSAKLRDEHGRQLFQDWEIKPGKKKGENGKDTYPLRTNAKLFPRIFDFIRNEKKKRLEELDNEKKQLQKREDGLVLLSSSETGSSTGEQAAHGNDGPIDPLYPSFIALLSSSESDRPTVESTAHIDERSLLGKDFGPLTDSPALEVLSRGHTRSCRLSTGCRE